MKKAKVRFYVVESEGEFWIDVPEGSTPESEAKSDLHSFKADAECGFEILEVEDGED